MDDTELLAEVVREVKGTLQDAAAIRAEMTARMDDIEKRMNRPGSGATMGAKPDSEHKALAAYARTDNLAELKAMSVGSDPDAGYFVLPVMASTMITKLFNQTPMRQLARVETITVGDAWEEPIDNTEPAAAWVGETETRNTSATPTVGMLRVPLQEIYALQPITQRLLDDTGFDLGNWLDGKITDKFARTEGAAFVNGNGVKKPRGFTTHNIVSTDDTTRAWGDLQYIPSGDSAVVTADALRALVWAVRAPYRSGSQWLLNSNTASAIDKMKDGDGQYLWRSSMTAGAPNTLLGYPVAFSEDMPDIAGNAYPIAFGNFKLGYLIVDRVGIKPLRDPFTDKPNVLFYAYKRVGGDVANSEALKLLKVATS